MPSLLYTQWLVAMHSMNKLHCALFGTQVLKYCIMNTITKCLLVRQPDTICRAIGPAITYFSSMRSVIGPHFVLNRVMYRETVRAPPLCRESAGLGATARAKG